jgi:nucleotide-binding universal stress UspA family protein
MRLLLAVDSVETAAMILNAVASRPWPRGTRARLLSVVEDDTLPTAAWREAGYRVEAVRREMRRRGEQLAALAAGPLRELGVAAEVAVVRGDPRWLITREAVMWPADAVFVRAHNRTGYRSWLLGSVARAVVREAPCTVEVVRPAEGDRAAGGDGPLKVLLATDGSEHSAAAARAVAERPWPGATEVRVLSTVNPLVYSVEEVGLFDGGGTRRAHRAIADAAHLLAGAGLKTSAEVIAGRPGRRIAREAGEWGADLVVVGTEDRRGLRRLLARSVAEAVADRAPCSVSVVRARSSRAAGGRLGGGATSRAAA